MSTALRRYGLAFVFAVLATGCTAGTDTGADIDTEDPGSEELGEAQQAVAGAPLVYGQTYRIQNGHQNWTGGGYLDVRGAGCEGNQLCVSTATSPEREVGTSTWKLRSADGKPAGAAVMPGDRVFLQNLFAGNGGHLDINGAGCEGNAYCVSTSVSSNRSANSGVWKILPDNGGTSALTEDQAVHLQNGYNNGIGGYLDTRAQGCEGNFLCVSTSSAWNRDNNSTHWRLQAVASPPAALIYGQPYRIQNGHHNWTGGGYLDTRAQGCEGNFLCVSSATTATRDGQSGSWMLASASGKPAGATVMPSDPVHVQNLYGGNGGYLDINGAGCEGNAYCVSTATSPDRAPGYRTGTWYLWPDSEAPSAVMVGQDVHIQNAYNNFNGGFLDTRAQGCEGNFLCVSTSWGWNRDNMSTHWRLQETVASSMPVGPPAVVSKFAPRLRFDGAAPDYPMSAQSFYQQAVAVPQSGRVDNTDYNTIANNQVPTYYQMTTCGNQIRIMYWWFYGYQHTCDGVSGSHDGDWENVLVTLSEDQSKVAAVTYYAHGDRFTRLAARGGFALEGTHPVVYAGKNNHGSFYDQGGSGTCVFWGDWRNNSNGNHMDTWSNLVSLDANAEPWMAQDRVGGFNWGSVGTHPTTAGPSCYVNACDWTYAGPAEAQGGTQCKDGDGDTGAECLKQCASGYTDGGLICTNWSTWQSYSRERYGYDYPIPTSDLGLLIEDY